MRKEQQRSRAQKARITFRRVLPLSLVEQTRKVYENRYQESMPDYTAKAAARFWTRMDSTQFILGLRSGYCPARRLPQIVFPIVWVCDAPTTARATLSKETLLDYESFNATAKDYIRDAPGAIDLEEAARAYFEKVKEFYEWFKGEQQRIHKDDFELIAKMDEKFEFYGLIGVRGQDNCCEIGDS